MAKGVNHLDPIMVLGAGIQGVCTALALAHEGFSVTLVDQDADCMRRTSLINEGKIHLGHVYANDPSLRTSRLMLEAALRFAPLVERWVGHPIPWAVLRSNAFTYVIAKDSIVTSERLFAHYETLNRHYEMTRRDSGSDYLGEEPDALWWPTPLPAELNPKFASAAVLTPEVSVDTAKFSELLRAAIEASSIERLYRHSVTAVSRASGGFRIEGTSPNGTNWQRSTATVINCLWADRLAIDEQLGVLSSRKRVYRLKYRILADLPSRLSHLPSLTIVLGPFGDLVTNPRDNTAYLSWYPACMRAWSAGVRTPPQWEGPASGKVDSATASAVTEATLHAFEAVVPGLGECRNPRVAAGIIFSWGETDIKDPASELHERHEIGVHVHDGYFSVDTGKFTCAPLFADQVAARLRASR